MKRVLSVLLLAGLMAADCGDSTEPTGTAAVVGTWTLASINGDPLPAPVEDDDFTMNVTSGSFTANANGTFSFTETSVEEGVDNTNGTWVAANTANTFTFTPQATPGEGNQATGTVIVTGDNTAVLTISNTPGVARQYNKN